LIGEVSPLAQIVVSASQGKDAYTGQPLKESGWDYMARSLAALSPEARLLGLNELGDPKSAASKAFNKLDPLKSARSVGFPLIGQTADQYAKSRALEGFFAKKYADPVPEASDNPAVTEAIYGKDGKGGWIRGERAPLLKLAHEHKLSKAAGEQVLKAEKPFFPKDEKLTRRQEKLASEAWETLTGGIFIPTKPKKVRRLKGGSIGGSATGGIGGSSSGSIGGYSLQGIGGPTGGSGGSIGGHPLGG
jgi:hypothetical protein